MASSPLASSASWVGEALVGGELGATDQLAQRRPVLARLQAGEREAPAVLGQVGLDERVARQHVAGGGAEIGMSSSSDSAIDWPMAHMPVPSRDTSTVVASPVRSRWNSAPMIPPAIVMAPMESPKPGPGGGTVSVPYSGRVAPDDDTGPGPERQRVVGALVGVGTALALAGAADVDDLGLAARISSTPISELRADAGQLVGEEDVGGGRDLVEQLEAVGRREVEPEAPLAPVGVLEQGVDIAAQHGDAGRRQTPHGVAPLDVLDLDHVGAPVGEQGRRRRHEGVLRHLEDAHALRIAVTCISRSPAGSASGSLSHLR